ncbi:MAG: hypothetical protein Q7U02_09190 [Desulfosalsimonadaceae bacterium]|nr:hypothetical protein [Desulfosalsimonadaceae bacterium]
MKKHHEHETHEEIISITPKLTPSCSCGLYMPANRTIVMERQKTENAAHINHYAARLPLSEIQEKGRSL